MTWAIIALLISINALYVAAEFSAVSVRRSRVRQASEDGNRFARLLLPYLEDPPRLDRYIAACQIGITISSLVLGAFGQARLAPALVPIFESTGGMQQVAAESTSAVVILILLTVVQMVLGELIPKSLALQFPTPLAIYTVIPMKWSLNALSWFIMVLNGSGILILRALGMRQTGHRHLHSPEEIEYLIVESREGGLLGGDEHERLRRALHLGVQPVEDVMIPRVRIEAIEADMPFDDVVALAVQSPYSRLPVYRGSLDRIVGFVHVQDVVRHSLSGASVELTQFLRPILVVPEGSTSERVLERLRGGRQHLAIVVDEFGGTKGLVTIGDILDEIFGGIAAEFPDQVRYDAETLADGRFRLPGVMRLDEASAVLNIELHGESHTVGGLISELLGHIPAAGERVLVEGVELEVESVDSHVVRTLLARRPKLGEDEGEQA